MAAPRPRTVKRSRLATLGLFVVLIVFFVLVFSYSRRNEGLAGRGVVFAAFVVALGGVVTWSFRASRRFSLANYEGLAHLAAGDPGQALVAFERAERRGRMELNRAVAVHNQGVALLALGEPARALEAFEAVARSPAFRMMGAHYLALPNLLATCHALLGDVPRARAELQEAVRRSGTGPGMFHLLPEAVVLSREGHHAAALKLLEERWVEAELTGGFQLKLLRIVRAFALDALEGAAARGEVERSLWAAEPIVPLHRRMLGARWPQLQAFLEVFAPAAP